MLLLMLPIKLLGILLWILVKLLTLILPLLSRKLTLFRSSERLRMLPLISFKLPGALLLLSLKLLVKRLSLMLADVFSCELLPALLLPSPSQLSSEYCFVLFSINLHNRLLPYVVVTYFPPHFPPGPSNLLTHRISKPRHYRLLWQN